MEYALMSLFHYEIKNKNDIIKFKYTFFESKNLTLQL